MKDSLFEILMNFFEETLARLKENDSTEGPLNIIDSLSDTSDLSSDLSSIESRTLSIKTSTQETIRIFTIEEQTKFTKASYQFLNRVILWDIIKSETLELIINQLLCSESRFVNLEETKWAIRNALSESLDKAQLDFLDLILYQEEHGVTSH